MRLLIALQNNVSYFSYQHELYKKKISKYKRLYVTNNYNCNRIN